MSESEPLSADEYLVRFDGEKILVRCKALTMALDELIQQVYVLADHLAPVLTSRPERKEMAAPPDPGDSVLESLKHNHKQVEEVARVLWSLCEECQL